MPGAPAVLGHLESGGTVVTATRRQARAWRRLHDAAQRGAGRRVWRSPDVLPLDAWLDRCWLDAGGGAEDPQLLAASQAVWCWRRPVRSHADTALLNERDLAGAARAAWVELVAFDGSPADLDAGPLTRDQQAFVAWATVVERDLADAGWLDPALLPAALARRAARFAPATRALLVGFDAPAPALRRLLEAIASAGGEAAFAAPAGVATRSAALAAEHPDDELEAILDWLAERLAERPDALLGVALPGLSARRGHFERAFDAALQPEIELPGALERDRRVDFAGGPPLASLQVAGDALAALRATGPVLELSAASRLLRSRYLGRLEEEQARLRLDAALRREGVQALPCGALARRARAAGAAAFAASLEAAARIPEPPRRRRASEWASALGELLRGFGWPGEDRPLASDEFQAAERFREALGQLAALERVSPALQAGEAVFELAALCEAPFQPERGDAQVLVYDAIEAPGVALDGLWVAGLTASAWPRASTPSPFLPLTLQRRLGMPGASPDACRAEAERITAAWLAAAPEVVLSWPLRQDDAACEPSRLLPAPLAPHARHPRPAGRAAFMCARGGAEGLDDDPAPPLDPGQARGGAKIVELQAKCPFRAFAELRLSARPLEEPSAGVDRRVRGNALHGALERLWRELGGSAGLESLEPAARAALVHRCVAEALREELPAHVSEAAARLEAAWQEAAVAAALDAESGRAPFEVESLERPLEARLAGVPLRLRVDRTDRTAAGLVIVDYKTGATSTGHWRGARPEAPQLPLYAVLAGDAVAAIAFAEVGASGARFRAVGEAGAGLPGMQAAEKFGLTEDGEKGFSWREINARWSAWLARLVEDHRAGVAAVDPKTPQTCRLCHLGTLCRVDRRAAGEEPEEEAGE
jgi:probable DNA repair protein